MSARKKAGRVKARKMFGNGHDFDCEGNPLAFKPTLYAKKSLMHKRAYLVLPADAASYAAMVEQAAKKMQHEDWGRGYAVSSIPSLKYWRIAARAALAAIGIKEPRK